VEEEKKLEDLVRQFGEKSWAKVAAILGNRSDVQCRYHFRQMMNGESDVEEKRAKEKKLKSLGGPSYSPSLLGAPVNGVFLSLCQARKILSTPIMMIPPHTTPTKGLLLPLAPVVDRRKLEAEAVPIRTSVPTPKWGVCGADRRSLELFLRQFA
jgi:hypothetical protein